MYLIYYICCMIAESIELEFFQSEAGKLPLREWLDHLKDKQGKYKIWARIERIRLGNFGDCRSVGQGVMELKIDFGPGYRIYFSQMGNKLIILLHGGDKNSQKKDIALAHDYWADYKRRYEKK